MRNRRTPERPLFEVLRPNGAEWSWHVSYMVASSGYPTKCHVTAMRTAGEEELLGTASCAVSLYDDLREVIECLATEAMLAACQPTLGGETPHRNVIFTSHL